MRLAQLTASGFLPEGPNILSWTSQFLFAPLSNYGEPALHSSIPDFSPRSHLSR